MIKKILRILELRLSGYLFFNNNSLINNINGAFSNVNNRSEIGSTGYQFLENCLEEDQNEEFYKKIINFFEKKKNEVILRGKESIKDYSIEIPEQKLIEFGVQELLFSNKNLSRVLDNFYQNKSYKFLNFKFYRNYFFDKNDLRKDIYSNFLHFDRAPIDSLKLMINYHLPSDRSGAMSLFDINSSREIIKKNIKQRFKKIFSKKKLCKFTPVFRFNDTGEDSFNKISHDKNRLSMLVWNPAKCLHGATIPSKNNYRDTLVVQISKN